MTVKPIRKVFLTLFSFALFMSMFAVPSASIQAQGENKPRITVTTSFLEDIVRQIADDSVDTALIVPAGGDPHIYNAQASDLKNILEADLVLYHGLHFEAQMADILSDYGFAVTRNFAEEDLIYVSEDSAEIDPHYWFNLDLYKQTVTEVRDILTETFPEHTDVYEENTQAYMEELNELSEWIETELEKLHVEERILVTPHDAFTYFAQVNDFVVYAPQGISTESEVSNEQIIQTVNFIVENNVPAIFLDTTSNPQAMEKLREGVNERGAEVEVIGGAGHELFSDSLAAEGQPNDNYIDMYKHNLSLIVDNLVK